MDELVPIELWMSFYQKKPRVKAIRFDAFAAEVMALSNSYPRRLGVVLREFAEVSGAKTTRDLDPIHVVRWIEAQHDRQERYCTVILGMVEVLEAIASYAKIRGYVRCSPFDIKKPVRMFPNGTFEPRRSYRPGCDWEAFPPPKPPEPLILGGPEDLPLVFGIRKGRLSISQYNAVQTVRDYPGLTKDGLDEKSGHPDTRTILRKLRRGDPEWTAAILFPGRNGRGGYRIASLAGPSDPP